MDGALGRHPEISEHEPTCTRGRERLIDDSLAGYDKFFPKFCQRLGFEFHRRAPRGYLRSDVRL
jgi:hypothetical protein